MRWVKKGLVFTPNGNFGWMNSHAQVPTVLVKEDRLRVYFASRPRQDLSLAGFIDLDKADFTRILYIHPEPILALGRAGEFDEHGIMPSSVLELDGRVYLYYSGWQRKRKVPYNNFTGLAISEDGGTTFAKYANNPVLAKTPQEPYSATSPCVYRLEDGTWHMWYSSGTHWIEVNGKFEHTYDIKYALSNDGMSWERTYATAVSQRTQYEAITKPTVIRIGDAFHMWFCYRGSRDFRNGKDSYRIGYAISPDLQTWNRNDTLGGIDVSDSGWDSRMLAYPDVKDVNGDLIMFYNGDGFGTNGFGCAVIQ